MANSKFIGLTAAFLAVLAVLAWQLKDQEKHIDSLSWTVEPSEGLGDWVQSKEDRWKIKAPVPTSLCQHGQIHQKGGFRVGGRWAWAVDEAETSYPDATLGISLYSGTGEEIYREELSMGVKQFGNKPPITQRADFLKHLNKRMEFFSPELKMSDKEPRLDGEPHAFNWQEIALWVPEVENVIRFELCVERYLPASAQLHIKDLRIIDRQLKRESTHPNVLFIVVDTLRADALGVYTQGLPSSPNIDQFAREAFVYDHAWSQGTWTLPSTLSFWYSGFPRTLDYDPAVGIGPLAPTAVESASMLSSVFTSLSDVLQKNQYSTHAYFSNPLLRALPRARSGYDVFNYVEPTHDVSHKIRDQDTQIVDNAIEQMGLWADDGRPNFVYLHFMGPHSPLAPTTEAVAAVMGDRGGFHETIDKTSHIKVKSITPTPKVESSTINARSYLAVVRDLDNQLGRVFSALDEMELADNTIVALASDHGEMLGEYGLSGHQRSALVYNRVSHVPLIIRIPNQSAGRESDGVVGLVDIAPTILEAAGLGDQIPDLWEGRSLVGGMKQRLVVVQREGRLAFSNGSRYKVILDEATEEILGYYDREAVDGEKALLPVADIPKELRGDIVAWLQDTVPIKAAEAPTQNMPTSELTESLKALGYLE